LKQVLPQQPSIYPYPNGYQQVPQQPSMYPNFNGY
jgi:hypothetical protein